MNEAIIAHHAKQHKLICDSLGLSIDEENERRYSEDSYRQYRVPVTVVQKGHVTVRSYDPESAQGVVRARAALGDGLKDAEVQTEYVGKAVEV